jgi:hypothetical protein
MRTRGIAVVASVVAAVAGMLLCTPAGADAAQARFVAQAEASGLPAGKALALQAKVDGYLEKLHGHGTQVAPNQIDMHGAVLNVTVPGEVRPRQLGPAGELTQYLPECYGGAADGWFCAYEYDTYDSGDLTGPDVIGMWACDTYYIPWTTTDGSWINNQTGPNTRPLLTFTDFTTWLMPAAWSYQVSGVNWNPVYTIKNC